MFNKKKNYLKQTLIYAGGNLIKNIFFFVLIPIFTFKFAPSEYAIYSIAVVFMSFLNFIYLLGLNEALFSHFNHQQTSEYHFTFISSYFITLTFSATFFSLIIYHTRFFISKMLFKTPEYGFIFSIVALIMWFNTFFSITQSFLNIIEKSTSFIINKLIYFVSLVIFYSFGYFYNVFTLENVFKWLLYTTIIVFVSSFYFIFRILYKLYKNIEKPDFFSWEIIKDCISFGLPMVPGALSLLILSLSDRYLLGILSPNGLDDAGIYAISYKIGLIVSFLTSLFSLSYLPFAMKIAKKKYAKKIYQKFFNIYLVLGTLLSIGVILFSPEIYKIFINEAYFSGMKIVFFGTLSNFLIGIFYLINISFYNIKKSKYIAITVTIGALLNIVLNVISIPKYGMYGAGFSSIFSYLIIVIIHFFNAKKHNDLGYKFMYVIIAFFVVLFVSILNYIVPMNLTISIIKFVFYILLVYYIGFYKNLFPYILKTLKP